MEILMLYLIDVVGFGKSDMPEHPLKSDDFGDFLRDFIKALEIDNPILIGHSNGGRMIINAVGRGLVKAKKVILISLFISNILSFIQTVGLHFTLKPAP